MKAPLLQRIADAARIARMDPARDAAALREMLLRIEIASLQGMRPTPPTAPAGPPKLASTCKCTVCTAIARGGE